MVIYLSSFPHSAVISGVFETQIGFTLITIIQFRGYGVSYTGDRKK